MTLKVRRELIDGRESLRFPTLFSGNVRCDGRTMPVMIDNLSISGAHVRLAETLVVGARVILTANGLDCPARVVRVTSGGYGLRLDAKIDPLHVVRSNLWIRRPPR